MNKSEKSRRKSRSSLLLYRNDPGRRQLPPSGMLCASRDGSAHKLEMDHSQISPVLTWKTMGCLVMRQGGKGHQGGAGGQLPPEKGLSTGHPHSAGCSLPAALQGCDHPQHQAWVLGQTDVGLCLAPGVREQGRAGLCWQGAEGQSRLCVSCLVPEI